MREDPGQTAKNLTAARYTSFIGRHQPCKLLLSPFMQVFQLALTIGCKPYLAPLPKPGVHSAIYTRRQKNI